MCGFVGICFAENSEQLLAISKMRDALMHRGPDDASLWRDEASGVALGHRRLSIVDLSSHGRQPMISSSGRYVITFNGEIYNFRELKHRLEKEQRIQLTGHSDTEVLLGAIEVYGIDKALELSVGMFAFALWDKADQVLYLARDRFGEKPLYYGWIHHTLIFSSELKALSFFPGFSKAINKDILEVYLRYAYIPAPYSIYRNIYKVLPGKYLKISGVGKEEEKTYWSAKEVAQRGILSPTHLSFEQAADELERRVSTAVGLQMLADVPVGAFLSGGVDSSLITALMQTQTKTPIKTFSVGFAEATFDEAPYAKTIAAHLGTQHTELYMTARDCEEILVNLPSLYDEPFADPSQLPTFLVAKLAKEQVTVSLSGDGGDEFFGGYQRYFYAQHLATFFKYIPSSLRVAFGRSCAVLFNALPSGWQHSMSVQKCMKYARLLQEAKEKYDYYFSLMSINSSKWLNRNVEGAALRWPKDHENWLKTNNFFEWMMFFDTMTYLPDDILTKLDRTTMAVSLEGRVPFLDHRIYEFAWQLPINYKMQKGDGKKILKEILYRYVPKALVDRPKHGFGFPLGKWLRGPLKPLFEEMFSQETMLGEYFNVPYLKAQWVKTSTYLDHASDRIFWAIFVFYRWLKNSDA